MKNKRDDSAIQKTRLCLDARMYRHSGIGVYLLQLLETLKKDSSIELSVLVPESDLPEFQGITQILFKAPIYSLKEQALYPFRIPSCDLFWSPHYNVPLLPVKAKKRRVTIHDVYHLRYAHILGWIQRFYVWVCIYAACKWSEKIYTVSQFSKNELLAFFNVADKIEVVYNKVDIGQFSRHYPPETISKILQHYHIDFPFVLFVGNVKPHKNLITLIKAFEKVADSVAPVRLVVVGKKEGFITGDNEVARYLDTNPALAAKIHFTGEVLHEELPVFYRQSRLFVFPSLYEGFGYPPLEALAAGTKVICSNAGPMPEVCGDRVIYFHPTDVSTLASLLEQNLNNL